MLGHLSKFCVCVQDLEAPEQTYRKLGAKLVVGMPFKDLATSDTLYMTQIPPSSDKNARRALKRLQVRNQDTRTHKSPNKPSDTS